MRYQVKLKFGQSAPSYTPAKGLAILTFGYVWVILKFCVPRIFVWSILLKSMSKASSGLKIDFLFIFLHGKCCTKLQKKKKDKRIVFLSFSVTSMFRKCALKLFSFFFLGRRLDMSSKQLWFFALLLEFWKLICSKVTVFNKMSGLCTLAYWFNPRAMTIIQRRIQKLFLEGAKCRICLIF